MPAGVPISVKLIEESCKRRDIDLKDLRNLSNVEERTFRRVMESGRGSEYTASLIAGAMGISVNELKTGQLQPPKPKRKLKEHYKCSVYLDIPHADMVKTNAQREKTALLQKVISATSPIEPLRVEDGSTILHLSLTDADILRLLAAMMDNELDILQITKVVIPDFSWVIIMLALLNYNNKELIAKLKLGPLAVQAQPQLIHPEALSLPPISAGGKSIDTPTRFLTVFGVFFVLAVNRFSASGGVVAWA